MFRSKATLGASEVSMRACAGIDGRPTSFERYEMMKDLSEIGYSLWTCVSVVSRLSFSELYEFDTPFLLR